MSSVTRRRQPPSSTRESPSAVVRAGPAEPLSGAGLEAGAVTVPCRSVDVVVCRGCCCGTARKHPSCDHGVQLHTLVVAVATIPGARLRVTGCLDVCRHSNVVAIRDWRGPEPTVLWLGGLLAPSDTGELVELLRCGGAVPGRLRRRRVCPERPFPGDFEVGSLRRQR
jgi:hypothetical protein